MSEKPRPNSFDAEQAVLGAALQSVDAVNEAVETLRKEDFFTSRHAEIFDAIVSLARSNKGVDIITVSEELKRSSSLEYVGGPLYLADLVSLVPAPSSVSYYADIVREHATRRRLIETSEKIIGMSSKSENDAGTVLEMAEKEILEIGRIGQKEDYHEIKSVISKNLETMEKNSKLKKGELTGLRTGFKELDRTTQGLQKSDLIILAARPGMGKTSLALNIATNAAVKDDAVVIVFSLEMSSESLGQRILSAQARVRSDEIRSGEAVKDSEKAARIGEAANTLSGTRLIIDDTSAIQIGEIKNKCRRLRAKEGRLDLVIVDYLQLMDVGDGVKSSSRPENRQQEIATLSRMFKQLARDMECPVLVLSQLSRAVMQRSGHKPMLADLRESGAIEQDADIVMFVYQKEDSNDGEGPDSNLTRQLLIAKHRNGETGEFTLAWKGEYTFFGNYEMNADFRNIGRSAAPIPEMPEPESEED